jgi:hypothetical protein
MAALRCQKGLSRAMGSAWRFRDDVRRDEQRCLCTSAGPRFEPTQLMEERSR